MRHRARPAALGKILLLALALRLLLSLLSLLATGGDLSVFTAPDTASYLVPAGQLLHGRFSQGEQPEIFRTPGYPVMLVPGLLLGHPYMTAVLLQVGLSCLTVYLVYHIALLIWSDHGVALLGALLYAIEPLSIFYSSVLLTETLFAALLSAFLYCLIEHLKTRRIVTLVASAVLLGASAYVRPVSYHLPALVTVLLLVRLILAAPGALRRTLFVHACLFFLVSGGVIGLWQLRNKREAGYSGFAAVGDYNLYCYNASAVIARERGISWQRARREMGCEGSDAGLHADGKDHATQFQSMGQEARKIIRKHLLTYCVIHIRGILRVLLDPGAVEYLKRFKLYPATGGNLLDMLNSQGLLPTVVYLARGKPAVFFSSVGLGFGLGAYFLLLLFGFFSGMPVRNVPLALIACVNGWLLLVSGGPAALGRFRVPLMPAVSIMAGLGLYQVVNRCLRKLGGREPASLDSMLSRAASERLS